LIVGMHSTSGSKSTPKASSAVLFITGILFE
jgi:hypothetical protein